MINSEKILGNEAELTLETPFTLRFASLSDDFTWKKEDILYDPKTQTSNFSKLQMGLKKPTMVQSPVGNDGSTVWDDIEDA